MGLLISLIFITCCAVYIVIVLDRSNPELKKYLRKDSVPGQKSQKVEASYSYQCRDTLFTEAEIRFYQALKKAINDRFLIFGKVRVADVITPDSRLSKGHWQGAFNKISAKHFDFVLCSKWT
jgi:hypothetical protein